MNDEKFQQLFHSAQNEPLPDSVSGFDSRVMRSIRSEARTTTLSVLDRLSELFPRLAIGAAALMAVCVAADVCFSSFVQADLTDAVVEASEQWLFVVK